MVWIPNNLINLWLKYVFVFLISLKFKISLEIFDPFSPSYLEIREFSLFNQILLNLFEVSNAFYDNIWVNI